MQRFKIRKGQKVEKIKSFFKSTFKLAMASADRFRCAFRDAFGSGVKILAMFGLALSIFSLCVFFSVSLLKENVAQNTASKSPQNATPKVLKIAYSQNVGPLNPQGYNKNRMFAQNIVYEGLLKADKNGAIIPSLATSFALDTSGKVYTFSLRKGVKFSNGEEFNADAVVLNFASIIKSRDRHSWSGLAKALERVERIDDYRVKIVLKKPYAPTLNELALPRPFRFLAPSAFPPDLDLVAQNPEPIGTGAYMLVESKLGSYDKFAKNPHYWDAKRLEAQGGLYYDEVLIKVIFEPNSKLSALRAGQVDMIYGADEIPIRIFQEIRNEELNPTTMNAPANASAKSNFRAYISKNNSFVTNLVINSTHIKEAPLRQAIALAIDKEEIVSAVYEGIISPANSIFAHTAVSEIGATNAQNQSTQNQNTQSQSSQNQKARAPAHSRNLTKAREILASFGYTQQNPLKLELFFFGDKPSQKMLAQIIQSQLKEANIALSVRGLEPSMYANALRKGEFDMAFIDSWGAPYEPLSQLYSYTKPLGHGDYIAQSGLREKPRIDALISQAIKESASVANGTQNRQNIGQNHGTNPARSGAQNPQKPAQKSTHTNSAQELSDEAIELLIQSGVYIPLVIERNKAIAHSRIKGVEGVSSLSYEIPIWDFYE